MPADRPIDAVFAALAQRLQALHEADLRANPGGGLEHDRAGAVADIEQALSAVLDAFHALYDAIDTRFPDVTLDWFGDAALAFVLALRRAREAGEVRTLYRFHAGEAAAPTRVARYVFVDFGYEPERMDAFDIFVCWADFEAWLARPAAATGLHADTVAAIEAYLGAQDYATYAAHYDLEPARVFFNVVPLFVNAGAALIPLVSPLLPAGTTGGELFSGWMQGAAHADTTLPQILCAPFVLPA